MPDKPIPYFEPSIGPAEERAVLEVLRSGWLTTGQVCRVFESSFAEYVGARHAVAVNSCTAALHVALAACGVGPGDEVIVPTMTFAATAEVVIHLGAQPVLADIDAETLCIDITSVEQAMSPRTRAVIPVHYAGQAADLSSLRAIVDGDNIAVVEDAAHALPTETADGRVGGTGEAVCFSFYANKTITSGEGGMLTTDSDEIAESARRLSLHGLSSDAWQRFETRSRWDYDIEDAGYKYNMPDTAAAIGLAQLTRSDELHRERVKIARAYHELFAASELVTPLHAVSADHSWHLFVVRLADEAPMDRNGLIESLAGRGIGTSVHYRPLHMHTMYQNRFGYTDSELPVATREFGSILSLPIYPGLTPTDQSRIVETVLEILGE